MRDPKSWLQDILDAIEQIQRYTGRGRVALEQEELIRVWMFYHLQVIGEAAARLGRDFHQAHPEIPWNQIVAMRNILVHQYFGVDLDTIWKTVYDDLPALKETITQLIKQLERDEMDHP